jgi:hypothetical protein
LEEGETIYENKWVFEWVLFWRIMILFIPIPIILHVLESYKNQTIASPEYSSRFLSWIPTYNMHSRGLGTKLMEKVNYWGQDMWMWQHWVRKGILYSTVFGIVISFENPNDDKKSAPICE